MDAQTSHYRRRITSDRIKVGAPAERIVDRFGGLANFCEATGFGRSAVHAWMRNGLIPAKWRFDDELQRSESYQRYIIRIGAVRRIRILPEDFIEPADG